MAGRRHRGGILVMTLVILAICLAVLSVLAANQNVRTRTSINRIEAARARIAAESGIRRAIAALVSQDINLVQLQGDWFDLGNSAADSFVLTSGDHFRVQVIDASSLVSLNTATEDQLLNMGLTTEQAQSLLDWREAGETPRTEGAKDEFYNNLDTPYNTKLRRLDSIDELLLIRGFDPTVVYQASDQTTSAIRNNDTSYALYQMVTTDSFSPNVTSTGQARTDINAAQANNFTQIGIPQNVAQAIIARRNGQGGQFQSLGQALQTPGLSVQNAAAILDAFSLGGGDRVEGRINLNTATQSTLESIPGITTDISGSILSRQTNGGFSSLAELGDLPGMTLEALQQAADAFTVSSDVFLVRVIGTAGQTSVALEGVVRVQGGEPILEKLIETPLRDMRQLWNWEDEATNEVEISG